MDKQAIDFWGAVTRARLFLGSHSYPILLAAGFGMLTGAVGAGIALFSSSASLLELRGEPFGAGIVKNVGTVVGCLAYMALLRRTASAYEKPALIAAPFIAIALGVLGLSASDAIGGAEALRSAAAFVFGLGSGVGAAVWLEPVSLLPPLQIFTTVALSYCFNALANALCISVAQPYAPVCVAAAAAASALMLFILYDGLAAEKKPSFRSSSRQLSLRTSTWVFIFMFVHGVGTYYTMADTSAASMHLGVFLAGLFVLACIWSLGERFDVDAVYKALVPAITLGLVSATFLGPELWAPKTLLSFAMLCMYILLFGSVCYSAHRRSSSPVREVALYMCIINIAERAGRIVAAESIAFDMTVPTLILTLMLVIVATCLVMFDKRQRVLLSSDPDTTDDRLLASIGASCGLTEREMTVFRMLASGKGTAQISSEMFIAQSTVRVHISNVYKKLDVHSRQELDDLVSQRRSASL